LKLQNNIKFLDYTSFYGLGCVFFHLYYLNFMQNNLVLVVAPAQAKTMGGQVCWKAVIARSTVSKTEGTVAAGKKEPHPSAHRPEMIPAKPAKKMGK
jgi:hypothetical protein